MAMTRHARPSPRAAACLALMAAVIAAALAWTAIAEASSAQRRPTFSDSYVVVDPFVISVMEMHRVRGRLQIEFGLDIPDSRLRNRAEAMMPRLRDAYVRGLNRYAATRVRAGRAPDVADIAVHLQHWTNEVLGEEGARVLLMNVELDAI
jgi:flagellar basal body-associated protein FliL